MGVRDYKTTQAASIIQRACRMWEREGIWSSWMSKRYIKERALGDIQQRQGDSVNWKSTLRHRDQIQKCVILGPQCSKRWIGKGTSNSLRNAARTISLEYPKDEMAKGIWANKIIKVALNLWRIRRKNLPTKDRLISREMIIEGDCLLCNGEQESIDHLFFQCDFSKWLMKEAMEVAGSLVKTGGMDSMEDAARELNKVTVGSPTWGLQ